MIGKLTCTEEELLDLGRMLLDALNHPGQGYGVVMVDREPLIGRWAHERH